VVDQSRVISGLLKSGMAICAVLLVLKLTAGTNKIKFPWGLELSTNYSWVLLAIMTGIHCGLAILLVHQVKIVRQDPELVDELPVILTKATAEAGFVLAGFDPNMRRSRRMIIRSRWDPSFWVAYAGTLGLVASVIPWHLEDGSLRWGDSVELAFLIPLALALAVINWCTGSAWQLALIPPGYIAPSTTISTARPRMLLGVCSPSLRSMQRQKPNRYRNMS
jgi:hypothetical protein